MDFGLKLKLDLDIPLIRTTKKAVLTIQDGFEVSDDAYFAFATSVSLARNHPPRRRRKASPIISDRLLLMLSPFRKHLYYNTFFDFVKSKSQKNMKKWWISLKTGM